jgi:hypothetical protein
VRAAALAVAALVPFLGPPALAPPARAQDPIAATGSNLGGAGLLEMRNARFRPDGTLETGVAVRNQRQFWYLNFQALPFLETTFRVASRLNGTTGTGTTTDRSLDLKLRLLQEGDWWPAVALGLQDAIGTGIYAGEYLVASKRFGPFDFTLGMGWGRIGTGDDTDNPLGLVSDAAYTRPRDVGTGGRPNWNSWFRGRPVALFGGLEWSVPEIPTPLGDLEGLRVKLEYSGDALRDERGGWPARTTNLRGEARSRFNAGLQWQPNPWLDIGASWVNGTDALVRLSLRMDPAHPPQILPPDRPPPLGARPEEADAGQAAIFAALRRAGFRPIAYVEQGGSARLAVDGGPYPTLAQVAGRVMRAVQPHLPAGIDALHLDWRRQGVTVARLALVRDQFERAVAGQGSAEEILASSRLGPAEPDPAFDGATGGLGFSWGLEPRASLVLGDPKQTALWQLGIAAGARIDLGAGIAVAGSVAQRVAGNLQDGAPSDSVLPHVRSDYARYARAGENASIPALYAERIWNLAPDWFGRITGGWLEPMFAGLSTEVLWRPVDKPWALGLDMNWVAQREYNQRFSALGYSVATGHLSLYADLPWWNLYTVLRGGRYLAGDWGGTIELGRRFDSGIEVGGFATFTNVPFSQFGEGSFDKGIYVRIPLDLLGLRTAARATPVIRPVQRDGGQRLSVDSPLWEVARPGRAAALDQGYMGFLR